ncbi:HlyD family secretion protein [Chitinophaga sp. Cy-1792]|uniref:HlyD family secretion protein n=1 Tax=Chitinophaga sp. Cy-1792 TaxID=2608339 RepID=UPI0014213BBE|nr:HlyD family secretion protein [Chitinophaga sp. Cy-1792]NIG57473.1 HlyD family secretion protein [Chitinophaga sp. Cy-1792]
MKKNYIATDKLITRITGWMAGITVLALAIWGGYTLWECYRFEITNDAQVQEYVNPVISRAGGFIVVVKFEENQVVKKGDTLLVIDSREYTLQQDQTEAAIRKSEAQLEVLSSNIHTLQQSAAAANAQISGAKAKVWKQQLDYNRYEQMYKEEAATKQQLENMQAALAVNNSEYKTAEENYATANSRIVDARAEKEVVQAEILRLRALLDRHKLDVSYTVITAPYDGRMGRRTVEEGQMIDAGETLAYIVNNETDKWIVANYKETQVANMEIGDTVRIIADAYPGRTFSGTIISLSPATGSSFSLLPPDNSTGNYVKIVQRIPVRIRVDGSRKEIDKLKVGMNVNVYLPKQQHHG